MISDKMALLGYDLEKRELFTLASPDVLSVVITNGIRSESYYCMGDYKNYSRYQKKKVSAGL